MVTTSYGTTKNVRSAFFVFRFVCTALFVTHCVTGIVLAALATCRHRQVLLLEDNGDNFVEDKADVFLTVHLTIFLAINQLDAHILLL